MTKDFAEADIAHVLPHCPPTAHTYVHNDFVQDPALLSENQHHHEYQNHTAFAERGNEDGTAFIEDESVDKIVPEPISLDHAQSIKVEESGEIELAKRTWKRRLLKHWPLFVHVVTWLLFTGWWIAGLILHRYDYGWLIPFLLYLAITLRIVFFYVPISVVTKPIHFIWSNTARPLVRMVPENMRVPTGGLICISVILVGSFASPETKDNTRANRAVSLFGLAVFILILWATSRDQKKIVWHTVIVGMLAQFLIALFVLRTKAGYDIFHFISTLARDLLGFTVNGVEFFTSKDFLELNNDKPGLNPKNWFIITVLPAIVFFISIVQLLYYSNILQWFVTKFATFFFWSMRASGAEAVVAAASPFIGQGESAMLIRPFVPHLTMAELHQVMCSGFATIAGSVLMAYLSMGVNAQALVSSCVMSIPASLACSKLRWPEKEASLTSGCVVVPDNEEHRAANILHAFTNGAWLGLKITAMIAATLLCIISLIGLADGLLTWWGRYLNINDPPLTLHIAVGYICYPIAFLLGVSRDGDDLFKVGQLIGVKLISNEFVAYSALQTDPQYQGLSDRSRLIATYALCGFANIGSLGNQIGVLAQLSPSRSGDVSRVAFSAMLTGAISTFTSATIAGLLITDEKQYFVSSH
ncbi:hypothetical protein N7495_003310 [Penicillium taxi]|uniref:uncharacterized protein n=1 Tax=Penicillium taxi TaxID=168475 RepID=UPI0025456AB3|nr:uncharacterized protein N7495_003310 [Penicillium taxi]KAJ5902782.1 hypothetical protein N7495_003310 [Penicillium taxi]